MYTAHWWIISSLNEISQNMSSSLGVFRNLHYLMIVKFMMQVSKSPLKSVLFQSFF